MHEMEISEVLSLLTDAQRESVLAYARQFARSNAAVTLHGSSTYAQSLGRNEQTATDSDRVAKVAKGPLNVASQAPTAVSTERVIDGRERKPKPKAAKPALVGPISVELVKCSICGLLVNGSEFKQHWDLVHSAKKLRTNKNKNKKKKRKRIVVQKDSPSPHFLQGGLCSPR
jgi:hypothetical protein